MPHLLAWPLVEMEDATAVAPRTTLLDVVQERMAEGGGAAMVSRLVYVGRTSDKLLRADEMASMCERVLSESGNATTVGGADGAADQVGATGMLLVFQTVCVHMVEAPTRQLMAAVRGLTSTPCEESLLREARIIAFTEDVPSRAFAGWRAAYVSGGIGDAITPDDARAAVDLASSTNLAMLKLGGHLSTISETDARGLLANLKGKRPDLLPAGGEQLLGLLAGDDAPTLDEFLAIFDEPIDVDLDSEKVWPTPKAPWWDTGLVG